MDVNMNAHGIHSISHLATRKNSGKVIIHRNSKNILSILFDEVNFSEDNFVKLKHDLNSKHKFIRLNHSDSHNEIFSVYT